MEGNDEDFLLDMKKVFVIKIGGSVLLTNRNKLDEYRVACIAEQVMKLRVTGIGVVLVVSGAVGSGSTFVEVKQDAMSRRLAAGVGQAYLTSIFYQKFKEKGLAIAQILFKKDDFFISEVSRLINPYIELGVIPIINENDVLELNGFKGNDFLGAQVAIAIHATKFIMLSTMKGSVYGVGGGGAKQDVINILKRKHIDSTIVNGKVKNIILKTFL
ncbi:hypothetical protein HZC27_04085 [Candidatus Roizmanbacteria bacterium]|nr:hypothetical protein [Candidatus Roizmanbacteria bacterium]